MAVIQGTFSVNGIPRQGATAKLWSAGAFLTPPSKDDPIPSGSAIDSCTTGPSHGHDGGYRFAGVTVGEYYVSFEWNGSITYDYHARNINPIVSVINFGAVGDGTTDDTTAIQAALNAAAVSGGTVYLPPGTYKTTSPLQVKWTAAPDAGLPTIPLIGGIKGDGNLSVISATITGSERAALEFLGETNSLSVNMFIRDFRIYCTTGSSSGSYCMRVGDCKDSFLAERIRMDGANGVRLKVASSSSYAQMNTIFRQCAIRTNYASGWVADESLGGAYFYAIYPESGGAKMDNIRFEGCTINGYCEPRAHQFEFDCCQFFVNPLRGTSSGRDFGMAIALRIGSLSVNNCYFEDHSVAIFASPTISDIDSVSIQNSHFSGRSNYAGASGTLGIHIVDSVNELNSVSIRDCRFGDDGYVSGSIRINGGTSVIIENPVNFATPSGACRILKVKPNWTITDGRTLTPSHTERFTFQGIISSVSETINPRLQGQLENRTASISKPCWISKITVYIDDLRTAGSFTVRLSNNGSLINSTTFPTDYTTLATSEGDLGYYEPGKTNPSSAQIFDLGDLLTVQNVTSSDIAPLNMPYTVVVEMAS